MILHKRVERAFSLLKERAENKKSRASHEDPMPLEKGDMAAMYVSAFLVFIPAALVTLAVMVGLAAIWIL
ncbi:MAG: hypothetical protein PHP02_02825 [Eubacteriales bacterium]|nr:hypothetical protein [Eubacteriales bacterium]